MHALTNHAQTFLDSLLEGAADGHYLADRFHAGAQLAVYALEFAQVPTGYFADNVVESRLEEGAGLFGNRVFQVEQAIAQAQFGSHEGQRITRSFRGEGRRAAQTGIHLDYPVVFRFGIEGILHVTLAHDADVADNADSQFAQFVIFAVGECLRRSHHDTFARVDTQRVEVLHVAYRDAVVVAVAHHLVFNLFPAFKRFLYQNLGRERQRLFGFQPQLLFVVAETAAQSAQRIGSPDDDGVAQFGGSLNGIFYRVDGFALNGLDIDFVEFLDEEFAVFGIHDGLYRRTQYLHVIFLERAGLIELYTAVESRLPAEGQQDAVGLLLLDNPLDEVGGNRQEVNLVGHTLRGLYRGDVGVDQNRRDAFLFEGFQGLRPGIVKFTGFTYFQGSGA